MPLPGNEVWNGLFHYLLPALFHLSISLSNVDTINNTRDHEICLRPNVYKNVTVGWLFPQPYPICKSKYVSRTKKLVTTQSFFLFFFPFTDSFFIYNLNGSIRGHITHFNGFSHWRTKRKSGTSKTSSNLCFIHFLSFLILLF